MNRDLSIAIAAVEKAEGVMDLTDEWGADDQALPMAMSRAQAHATIALAHATIALAQVNTELARDIKGIEREIPRIRGAMR